MCKEDIRIARKVVPGDVTAFDNGTATGTVLLQANANRYAVIVTLHDGGGSTIDCGIRSRVNGQAVGLAALGANHPSVVLTVHDFGPLLFERIEFFNSVAISAFSGSITELVFRESLDEV